jgi:hypothetical protein
MGQTKLLESFVILVVFSALSLEKIKNSEESLK